MCPLGRSEGRWKDIRAAAVGDDEGRAGGNRRCGWEKDGIGSEFCLFAKFNISGFGCWCLLPELFSGVEYNRMYLVLCY